MMRSVFIATLIALLLIGGLQAQFGKNKVQYDQYNWRYIQTEHFDIYFYKGGKKLATFAAEIAEQAIRDISAVLNWRLRKRVALIVYNSHSDFQQTNVTLQYLQEGIGGFTELFKNRAVVPFDGSNHGFWHVVRHELVHVMVNDMIYGGNVQSIISGRVRLSIPTWMNEGLAEYISMGWDTNADMILRDLAIANDIPTVKQLDRYMAYKGGQSVYRFLADKYGDQKIGEIWSNMKGHSSAEKGFEISIGMDMKELSEAWHKWVRTEYWPDVADRNELEDISIQLTDHEKLKNYFNTAPAISPNGSMIAFMSDRKGYADIFLMSSTDGEILDRVVSGQRTPDLEELKWLNPRLSWSPAGNQIVLAVKSGGRDALITVDTETKKRNKYTFKTVDEMYSAAWSPDGDRIAFIGLSEGRTNLYVYHLKKKKLYRLTKDWYSDFDPSWSPDGQKIIFASERETQILRDQKREQPWNYNYHQTDLFVYDLKTKKISQLTDSPWNENYPVWANTRDVILFISDREGVSNLYALDLTSKDQTCLTNVLTGIFQPSISGDDSRLVYAGYAQTGWDIYTLSNPLERMSTDIQVKPTHYAQSLKEIWANPQESVRFQLPSPEDVQRSYTHKVEQGEQSYSNYIFAPHYSEGIEQPTEEDTTALADDTTSYVNKEGDYIVNPYKTRFTLDLVDSQAGYSTFWGFQGTTVFAFSDLLGDHRLTLGTEMYIDLENSDYYLSYAYLGWRTNFGVTGFHTANFWQNSIFTMWRWRSYGADFAVSRPFSKFSRIELGLTSYNVEQKLIDLIYGETISQTTLNTLLPRTALVFDNTLWSYFYPIDGWRWRLDAIFSPRYNETSLDFKTLQLDLRRYFKASREYSFAMRLSTGISEGKNAQRFFLGGERNWINPRYSRRHDMSSVEDIYFSEFITPLRGARYYEREGNRYFLTNFEFRYPFIKYLSLGWPLPLRIGGLQGVTFLDLGAAWFDDKFHPLGRDKYQGLYMDDLVSGFGCGTRIFFGYFLLKIDVAWRYDFNSVTKPQYYFSLGLDF